MDRETGPFGLKKQFSYQEVLRAIQQQPYDILVPARVGLRTWEDPFYQNMRQDQASYQGDVAKSGFSHEAPFQPPQRDEVYYDARSDAGGEDPPYSGSGGGRGPPPPPPPPPPPGNLGVLADLFRQRPGNQPIQSGFMAPPEVEAPPSAVPRSAIGHTQLPARGRGSAPNPSRRSPASFSRWGRPFERVLALVPWSVLARLAQPMALALLPWEGKHCAGSGTFAMERCAHSIRRMAIFGVQLIKLATLS